MPTLPNPFKKGTLTHVSEVKEVDFDCDDNGKPVALITGKDSTFGMNPVIKTFYEGKHTSRGPFGDCNYDWVESPPKQLSAKKTLVYDRVALKVYKVKDFDQPTMQGRTPLKIHMIEVQSPHLILALKPIVESVGIFLEVHEVARFEAPFRPLYFCYDQIRTLYHKHKSDPVLGAHLRLLLSVLSELFDGFRSQLRNLRDSGLINYKLAWTYFARGSTVYSQAENTERLIRVVDTDYVQGRCNMLVVQGEELAFNGNSFIWQPVLVRIPYFDGNLPITDLPHYPFSFHPTPDAVKARLAARGKKVIEYQDVALRECEGVGLLEEAGKRSKCTVSGRVIIDFYGYQKYHKGLERTENQDASSQNNNSANNSPGSHHAVPNQGGNTASSTTKKEQEVYVQRLGGEKQAANKTAVLSKPEDLPFLAPELYGYSLKAKLWLEFHVNDMRPVQWNDEAYEHLVYPEEQKDLVLSFVQNHRSSAQAAAADGVDDVILGKGRGLVILLSGPPGTGKTLTAEATADQTRRPLFSVQAEDLGTNAAQLGAQLKRAFAMAADWNAVVLLDEADVFMAVRQVSDVLRNELVSIFLRELEYFSGTIFLTTNLLANIDQAFRSRVDIHLLFNPLPATAREVLWRKFLSRLPTAIGKVAGTAKADDAAESAMSRLDDAALHALSLWDLNGREIKNAVKTVRTWCVCKGYAMDLARLEAGIRVTAPMARKLKEGEPSRQGKGLGDWTGEGGWGLE